MHCSYARNVGMRASSRVTKLSCVLQFPKLTHVFSLGLVYWFRQCYRGAGPYNQPVREFIYVPALTLAALQVHLQSQLSVGLGLQPRP
jgi:hypothetical protein